MHSLIKIQLTVIAAVLLMSLAEALVLQWRKPGGFVWAEAWLSVADLFGRYFINLMPLNLATPFFALIWPYRLTTLDWHNGWNALLLFVGLEFCYYWYHRTAHRVRFFWATHAVHHSPNQLTLSTAYRLGWTGRLTGTLLFFTPLVWLGFEPKVVTTALELNLLYQFWVHATWIPKLGWLEYVLNTPSAHRVHHASNLEYLDANYGGVLIIFDRLFGSYVAEREDLPCVYGLVHPMTSRNLLVMEFSQWRGLWQDIRHAPSLRAAMGYILKPPGWSPDGPGQTTEALRGQLVGQRA